MTDFVRNKCQWNSLASEMYGNIQTRRNALGHLSVYLKYLAYACFVFDTLPNGYLYTRRMLYLIPGVGWGFLIFQRIFYTFNLENNY